METKDGNEVNQASCPKWCLQAAADTCVEALFYQNKFVKVPLNTLSYFLVTYVTEQGLGKGKKSVVVSSLSGCLCVGFFSNPFEKEKFQIKPACGSVFQHFFCFCCV